MTKDEALELALGALWQTDDFLFDNYDCKHSDERELSRYEQVRKQNKEAILAINKVLSKS